MNKDSAKLYLPLVQALADGKLQYQNFDGSWSDTDSSDFRHNPNSYRIKPEPFECWENIYERYSDSYRSEIDAINNCNEITVIRRAVHMREVADEE